MQHDLEQLDVKQLADEAIVFGDGDHGRFFVLPDANAFCPLSAEDGAPDTLGFFRFRGGHWGAEPPCDMEDMHAWLSGNLRSDGDSEEAREAFEEEYGHLRAIADEYLFFPAYFYQHGYRIYSACSCDVDSEWDASLAGYTYIQRTAALKEGLGSASPGMSQEEADERIGDFVRALINEDFSHWASGGSSILVLTNAEGRELERRHYYDSGEAEDEGRCWAENGQTIS